MEYGLILALIVLVVVAAIGALGVTTSGLWNDVLRQVRDASA